LKQTGTAPLRAPFSQSPSKGWLRFICFSRGPVASLLSNRRIGHIGCQISRAHHFVQDAGVGNNLYNLQTQIAARVCGLALLSVQYRLNRLESLGYLKSVPGKSRSRFLTEKGQSMVKKYDPKINDWRKSEETRS